MNRRINRIVLTAALATVTSVSVAFAKRDPDVDKALKKVYPDAKTQIMSSSEINGVKVQRVKVTTKQGESDADVTENGDFLRYGLPRESSGTLINVLQQNTAGLFKEGPKDVDMYRITEYVAELQGPNNKTYQARFDAVGRLQDLSSNKELTREQSAESTKAATGAEADQAKKWVTQYFPDQKVSEVNRSSLGSNFYTVHTDKGEVVVSATGQVYAIRENVAKDDIPNVVNEAIGAIFQSDKVKTIYRNEWQYYQFNETTRSGQPLTVWMRPNGDIIKVISPETSERDATLAGHTEAPAKKNKAKK